LAPNDFLRSEGVPPFTDADSGNNGRYVTTYLAKLLLRWYCVIEITIDVVRAEEAVDALFYCPNVLLK
jgi:hypothetical protein